MNSPLIVLAAILTYSWAGEGQRESGVLPLLTCAAEVAGAIEATDPEILTDSLREEHGTLASKPRGDVYRIDVAESGTHRIRAVSAFVRPFLVLRDGAGNVLAEDAESRWGLLPELTVVLDSNDVYHLEVASLYGDLGPYSVSLEAAPFVMDDSSDAALVYARSALAEVEDTENAPPTALGNACLRLGKLLQENGDARSARRLLERALQINDTVRAEHHPATAYCLDHLAVAAYAGGDHERALECTERSVAICESMFGKDSPRTASTLNLQAAVHAARGEYAAARLLYERAIRIFETAHGPDHPDLGMTLNNLASTLESLGDFDAARPTYERALQIAETSLGAEHPSTARSMNNLAGLLHRQGRNDEARPYFERTVQILEKTLGPGHPATATAMNNFALLLRSLGEYESARSMFERSLRAKEAALGPGHPSVSTSLNNLALLAFVQGDYAAEQPLFERALAIREATLGPEHPATAECLTNLAMLLRERNDLMAAEPLLERALRIREKALGPDHPETASALHQLAILRYEQGRHDVAKKLLERALRIREAAFGSDHSTVAANLNNLSRVLRAQGDPAAARDLLERALLISERCLGPDHPETAPVLASLADLLRSEGNDEAARAFAERTLRITETSFGSDHPSTASSLNNLAIVHIDRGDAATAAAISRRAVASSEAQRTRLAWSLSEAERILLAEEQREALHIFLSVTRDGTAELRREAYDTLLRWKSQVLRSLASSRGRALADLSADNRRRVESLLYLQRRLSTEFFAADDADSEARQARLADLRARRQKLEVELSRSLGPSNRSDVAVSAELAVALPEGSVLVDFLVHPVYQPPHREDGHIVDPGEWTDARLSAWVLRAGTGSKPDWVDLGPAQPIEVATQAFLRALVASRGVRIAEETGPMLAPSERLRSLLWDPLTTAIGAAAGPIFISPDSFLGSLPFEVLRDREDRFLIERYAFVYLQDAASIVEIVRGGKPSSSTAVPATLLCVGGVDYRNRDDLAWKKATSGTTIPTPAADAGVAKTAATSPVLPQAPATAGLRGSFFRRWVPLPSTRDEAAAVADIHGEVFPSSRRTVLQRREAGEERVKHELPRHRVLHLATHGFFEPQGLPSMWQEARGGHGRRELTMRAEERRLTGLLPSLLSGLVFAGANHAEAESDRDDGLLTAEEISFLDLSGADLVVLSACESGLGRSQSAEGMMGFRRTFRLAGASTVISSLWRVSDESTRTLMQSFYEKLWLDDASKLDALRGAQLDMLRRNRIENDGDGMPSTWGAFILDGDWRH